MACFCNHQMIQYQRNSIQIINDLSCDAGKLSYLSKLLYLSNVSKLSHLSKLSYLSNVSKLSHLS